MKTKLVLGTILFLLLAIVVLSKTQSNKIIFVDKQVCATKYYEEIEPIYNYVTRIRNTYGKCFEPSNSTYYSCVNGTEKYQSYENIDSKYVTKSKNECRPASFEIKINKRIKTEKKKIDFSPWGVCIQENEGNCIAIICGNSRDGSAVNGEFRGCSGGRSCKKFVICEDGVKTYVKNSNPYFMEQDPTYNLPPLDLVEVEE